MRSFLCFFFRIFLRRFLTTEGKLLVLSESVPGRPEEFKRFSTLTTGLALPPLLVGPEQMAQVNPADSEVLLQPHRAELQRFRGLLHR